MNRTEYRAARRLIRDNGRYALTWLDKEDRRDWTHLLDAAEDSYSDLVWMKRTMNFTSAQQFLRARYYRFPVLSNK